jgi:predicted TIM-barrel fold metal-dependent hydrolase
LKVFKQLGLGYRDADGKLLRIDDPRWDPIWAACGQLGLPVLFHVADPLAFFDPIDETNERFEELIRHPEWSFHGNGYPTHQELMSAFERVLERHPQTDFIGAHMASLAEDLAGLGKLLDRHPNLYLDIASRIAELGRQPFTARAFLLRYQDRILFGTDGPWPESRLVAYWRFLETHDEYFPYSEKEFPPQGFWQIYGVALPEETLRAIYSGNAARLIPGVAERLETWSGAQPALQPPPSQANPGDPSAAPSDQSSPPSAE